MNHIAIKGYGQSWLSLSGWIYKVLAGEMGIKIAGLQTDDITDRQQVADRGATGKEKPSAQLFIMCDIENG